MESRNRLLSTCVLIVSKSRQVGILPAFSYILPYRKSEMVRYALLTHPTKFKVYACS